MNTNKEIVATFEDRYGEKRHIHNTRHGLTLKRRQDTACQILSKMISGYVGERVKALRLKKEMTRQELCTRAGISHSGNGKERIYAIENNSRSCGVRFGTVYQLAIALECGIE